MRIGYDMRELVQHEQAMHTGPFLAFAGGCVSDAC